MLNIARQIYSGWNTGSKLTELHEAEVIPFGNSSNEKKRLDGLTKRYNVLKEHENIPLPGFTLYKTSRKNYGSADPTWLVIDPRGYLVRITNENLESILHVTGITEGLIQEKCVWAREDTQTKMILVPVSSESYIEATNNTALIEGKVSVKDLQIGDKVMLQNKLEGIFMGVQSLYGPVYGGYDSNHKAQAYLRRQIIMVEKHKYHYQTDAKILKVVEKTDKPITREEAVAAMNEDIQSGKGYFTNASYFSSTGYYSTHGMITYVSTHAVPKVPITLEEVTLQEASELFDAANKISDSGVLILENAKGKKFLIDFPYSFNQINKVSKNRFPVDEILSLKTGVSIELVPQKSTTYIYHGATKDVHALDKFTKFYKIVKHVKSETFV